MTLLPFMFALLVFAMLTSGAIEVVAASGYDKAGYEKQKKMDEVSREMAKTVNQQIVYYGRVVDFDGNPVRGAEVDMSVRVFGARTPGGNFRHLKVATDNDGYFMAESFGELITLDSIQREGYFYHYRYNPKRTVHSAVKEKRKGLGYEPDKPMVFRMRKLAPAAYLTSSNWEFGLKGDKVQLLDMYEHMWASPDRVFTLKMGSPHWHPDVKFSVETAGNNFHLVLEALDEDSGFIEQKAEFYEELTRAPETGYQQKISVPVNRNSGGNLMLYVKSEGGLFYSRMWVRYSHDGRYDGVRVNVSEATNPTGDTILENDHERYRQRSRDSDAGKYWKLSRELLRKGELYIPQPEPKP